MHTTARIRMHEIVHSMTNRVSFRLFQCVSVLTTLNGQHKGSVKKSTVQISKTHFCDTWSNMEAGDIGTIKQKAELIDTFVMLITR